MAYTLSQAAMTAGVRKSTVFRWVKAGKVSATRLDDGQFRIDPAELQRYLDSVATEQPKATPAGRPAPGTGEGTGNDATDAEMQRAADALRAEVAKLQALLEAERQRSSEWKGQAERWAATAERLMLAAPVAAPGPVALAPAPSRGLFGWLRRSG